MGMFKIKKQTKLSECKIGEEIPESDFSCLGSDGVFTQLEYIESESKLQPTTVKPGVWTIQKNMMGMSLIPTSFVSDKILESFVHTKDITEKIDCFFRNLHIYKDHGIEIAKRSILLYGPAGTGKSSSITKVVEKYHNDDKTTIVVWNTDKYEAYEVKDFIKSFTYVGVDKLILIAEDLGGVEMSEARRPSDSSLLSLLDNQEKTFTIPVLILATTNHPEMFLGNLTNRPQRFDDKIKVGFPPTAVRIELLKFFSKKEVPLPVLEFLGSSKGNDFSPAHIKEIVIRSAIYEKDMLVVANEILAEIELFKKAFVEKGNLGF